MESYKTKVAKFWTIIIFEIDWPNLSKYKCKNKKTVNLRPKIPYLGIFGLEC